MWRLIRANVVILTTCGPGETAFKPFGCPFRRGRSIRTGLRLPDCAGRSTAETAQRSSSDPQRGRRPDRDVPVGRVGPAARRPVRTTSNDNPRPARAARDTPPALRRQTHRSRRRRRRACVSARRIAGRGWPDVRSERRNDPQGLTSRRRPHQSPPRMADVGATRTFATTLRSRVEFRSSDDRSNCPGSFKACQRGTRSVPTPTPAPRHPTSRSNTPRARA